MEDSSNSIKIKKRIKIVPIVILLILIPLMLIYLTFFNKSSLSPKVQSSIEEIGKVPYSFNVWGNMYSLQAINETCLIFLKSLKDKNESVSFAHDLKSNKIVEFANPPLKANNVSNLVPVYNPSHPNNILLSFSGETNKTCLFNLIDHSWNCSLATYPQKNL